LTLGLWIEEVMMKPLLKPIFAALAGASLLAAPVVASAQHTGGHAGGGFHGGGFHGGGFHGGGFRGGGFHGGFHGHGFRGGVPFVGGLGLGLAFGAAAYPWYDYPDYGYYGPAYAPDYAPDYAYGPPPPAQACGSWSWNARSGRYDWIPCE
jgi:hypothetical protein